MALPRGVATQREGLVNWVNEHNRGEHLPASAMTTRDVVVKLARLAPVNSVNEHSGVKQWRSAERVGLLS